MKMVHFKCPYHYYCRYNCNRFNESDARAARDCQQVIIIVIVYFTLCISLFQSSRAALERYLFYCNRYMNHLRSSRMEHKVNHFIIIDYNY